MSEEQQEIVISNNVNNFCKLLIEIESPNTKSSKEIYINNEQSISIGNSTKSDVEIFDDTVLPNHLTLTLKNGFLSITKYGVQTYFNKKNNEIFIGNSKLTIKQILGETTNYKPLNHELFLLLTKPINYFASFFSILILFFLTYINWFFDNMFFQVENNPNIIENYSQLYIMPGFICFVLFMSYLYVAYNWGDKFPKNKSYKIKHLFLYQSVRVMFAYVLVNAIVFGIGQFIPVFAINYLIIKHFILGTSLIYLVMYLCFLLNCKPIVYIGQLAVSIFLFLLTVLMFGSQITQELYVLNQKIDVSTKEKIEEKVDEIIKNIK